MLNHTPSSVSVTLLLIHLLVGCAGGAATSGVAFPAASETARPSSARASSALVGESFVTASGESRDVDLAWLGSEPFTVTFSELNGEPTIGFDGPCQGATFTFGVDDTGTGRILESRGMTYQACMGATGEHGTWFFAFINRPGVKLDVGGGELVMTSGSESVTAVAE